MDAGALLDQREPCQDPAGAWAASGAMALTGRAGGCPLGVPRGTVEVMTGLARRFEVLTAEHGRPVTVDGLALLGERAALAGLTRQGATSCGGAARLLPALDGWVAVSLPRQSDLELLPAWLGAGCQELGESGSGPGMWTAVAEVVAGRPCRALVDGGAELGLALAAIGEAQGGVVVRAEPAGPVTPPRPSLDGLVVVDLSSLWAGPLCGQLLAAAGLRVVKVESTRRPDGARAGDPRFFDLLNADKASVALDVGAPDGLGALRRLLERADVVIEASRPRALAQLGIDRAALQADGPAVWVSITGHGGKQPMRVGFGDDAAVAGGLVARDRCGPVFAGDAIADPATGLVAAVAVVDRLLAGGRWHLDIGLAGVAAWLARGPVLRWTGAVALPRARHVGRRAPPLGQDTRRVLGATSTPPPPAATRTR